MAALASCTLLLPMALPAFAQEHPEHDHHHAHGSEVDTKSAPPVAQRLWNDLVCLCGRCDRLTLSTCTCPDAEAERTAILKLLASYDLSTPEGERAAYAAVQRKYVERFGDDVLARNRTSLSTSRKRVAWAILAVIFAAPLILVVLSFTVWRRPRQQPSSKSVKRPAARRTSRE